MLEEKLFLCGASFSPPKSSNCDECIDILCFETRKIRQKLSKWTSQRVILELLERSRTLRDLRGPLFPKMGAPPRREHDFRNLYYQGTGSETMRERLFARKWLEVIGSMRAWGRGSRKVQEHNDTRVWEHEPLRAWCYASRISRSYGRKKAQ